MAVTLDLSYSERNDNCLLTLADISADWADGGNIDVTDITAATLDIVITTADGTETTYDQIDLVDEFGDGVAPEFNDQDALVFELDCSLLLVSGVAIGDSDDELPDGIWEFTYAINAGVGATTLVESVLIDGQVRVGVYDMLRILPTIYNCKDCKTKEVLDAIYAYGCLNVMQSDAYVAKTEELLSLLYTLERIVTNGSNYTW